MKILILSNNYIEFDNAQHINPNTHTQNEKCDILLVCADVKYINFTINTNISIIYGDLGFNLFEKITSQSIITYGMSNKNSATISSSNDSEILVSILREFLSFDKKIIEIIEFSYKKSKFSDLDCLATAILSLVLQ